MRRLLTTAAAVAVTGAFAVTPAHAEPAFYPGNPIQQGNMCQVYTDGDQYYGYLAPYPKPAQAVESRKKIKS
jgi:hypothetical protein